MDFFNFTLETLGYKFVNRSTLRTGFRWEIFNLYKNKPKELKELISGSSPKYRRVKKEGWKKVKVLDEKVMVYARKFINDRGLVIEIDKTPEEIKEEAERVFGILAEHGKFNL